MSKTRKEVQFLVTCMERIMKFTFHDTINVNEPNIKLTIRKRRVTAISCIHFVARPDIDIQWFGKDVSQNTFNHLMPYICTAVLADLKHISTSLYR